MALKSTILVPIPSLREDIYTYDSSNYNILLNLNSIKILREEVENL